MNLCLEKVNFPSYVVDMTSIKEGGAILFPYVKTLPSMSSSEYFSKRGFGMFIYSTNT